MKIGDFLEDLGRPVAYFPKLALALGGVKAAVFYCQLLYWKGKESSEDGGIYKTAEEIQEETGLSYKEQLAVRKHLKSLGVLKERYARLEHQLYFYLDKDRLHEIWVQYIEQEKGKDNKSKGNSRNDKKEGRESTKGKSANHPTGSSINTETTTETTETLPPNPPHGGNVSECDSASPQTPDSPPDVASTESDVKPPLLPERVFSSEESLKRTNGTRRRDDLPPALDEQSPGGTDYAVLAAPVVGPLRKQKMFISEKLEVAVGKQIEKTPLDGEGVTMVRDLVECWPVEQWEAKRLPWLVRLVAKATANGRRDGLALLSLDTARDCAQLLGAYVDGRFEPNGPKGDPAPEGSGVRKPREIIEVTQPDGSSQYVYADERVAA